MYGAESEGFTLVEDVSFDNGGSFSPKSPKMKMYAMLLIFYNIQYKCI